jgi:hypothetical protein
VPYQKPFEEDADPYEMYEMIKPFLELEYSKDEISDAPYELQEYGYLCEYSPANIERYVFVELSKTSLWLKKPGATTKVIPAGTYYCRQSETSQIKQVAQIFSEYLKGKASFLTIETEIFVGKYNINKPVHELRVIGLSGK